MIRPGAQITGGAGKIPGQGNVQGTSQSVPTAARPRVAQSSTEETIPKARKGNLKIDPHLKNVSFPTDGTVESSDPGEDLNS
jgi:hypothetical protein